MTGSSLDKRLEGAASFVPFGAFLADIGSDHAYLPIALCKAGKIIGAVAGDINEGPIKKARENIVLNHLEDKITAVRTNGLASMERFPITAVSICGMGGELIYEIINIPIVKEKRPLLILQPMSSIEDLSFLMADGGFEIEDDKLIEDGKKIYRVMSARYTGKNYRISPLTAHIGQINLMRKDMITLSAVIRLKEKTMKIAAAKRSGGSSFSSELALLDEIERYLYKV